jgi:hypothetical protein
MQNAPPASFSVDAAKEAVSTPAIFLAVLSAVMCGIFFLDFCLFAFGDFSQLSHELRGLPGGGALFKLFMPLVCVFAFGCNAFIFWTALRMRQLKSWPLAMAGAIAAMIPLTTSICCVAGLPLGIWALVVLNKPEVKAAFR